MPPALPIFRPLLLAVALPFTALACLTALTPGKRHRSAPLAHPQAAAPAPAVAGGPLVWVSNEGSGDLAVIDAATDEVVGRVHVGKRPRGVRLAADARLVFAAVSGSPRGRTGLSPAFTPAADRGADGIAVIDTAARRVIRVLPSGRDPASFDLVPGTRLLVVSNEETASASIVDVGMARIVATIPVGEGPEGVTASPDGRLVAVASEAEHRVDFLDPAASRALGFVPTCDRPRTVVFTPDGALAFAPCEEGAAIAVIDARALKPLGEIALPPGSRPMGAALSHDGRRLFVSNGSAGTVSVIDVASRTVAVTSKAFGRRVWGIGLTPDGRRLYVADGPANDVAVLDAATLAVLRRIPSGEAPRGVAIPR
jgi:YVTN family beta-propeller protein